MRICVFGASSDRLARTYFDEAEALGRLMAQSGHSLVFGGGAGGLMGACARGAAAAGGEILGVAPRFFDEPGVLFPGCSRFVYTDTMAERKAVMEREAEGFVLLPGGIGSYEEFFEVLTLRQLGRHEKPMAVLNTLDYYAPMLAMLRETAAKGFMSERCLALFSVCSAPETVLRAMTQPQAAPAGGIRRLTDYGK